MRGVTDVRDMIETWKYERRDRCKRCDRDVKIWEALTDMRDVKMT